MKYFFSPPPGAARPLPMGRRLLIAAGCMVLSGSLLIGGFLVYHLKELKSPPNAPQVWLGRQLQLMAGKGVKAGEKLKIQALSPRGRVIVSSGRTDFLAADYPILEYRIEGLRPEMDAVFFWRRAVAPKQLMTLPLAASSAAGSAVLRLAGHDAWRGDIVEFGMAFRRVLPAPVTFRALVFKPASVATLLAGLWSGWTAFEGWSQRSINFLGGGTGTALVAPALAVAMWVGAAILLYGICGLFLPRFRRWDQATIGMIFLLGWITLDSGWQVGLWNQLQATYARYAGKDWREKHLAAEDASLFRFITGVKSRLPASPQRIFLVVAESLKKNEYLRSRARYHLLPHNIYDYGIHLPPSKYVQAGNYVLMLGPVAEFPIDAERQILRWREKERNHYRLKLKKIYAAPKGILYKVLSPTSSSL